MNTIILYKNYNNKNKILKNQLLSLIDTINKIREEVEKYKNSNFWNSPSTSPQRNKYKGTRVNIVKNFSKFNLKIEFIIDLDCSCNYVYKTQKLYINNEKKKIAALRTIENDLMILDLIEIVEVENV